MKNNFKIIVLVLFFLGSCNTFDRDYVCLDNSFNLDLKTDLSNIENKKISNNIIRLIRYDKDNSKTLVVSVAINQTNSALLDSNVVDKKNVNLYVIYSVIEKDKILYNGQFKIVNSVSIAKSNRYINIVEQSFSNDILFEKLAEQLKDRIDIFLNSCFKK
jgi:hypothetical protein